MNSFETPRTPKRFLTPDYLANEAWHFADALTGGRWSHDDIQKVTMKRSVAEMMGNEYEISNHNVMPIIDELSVTFSAVKRIADFYGTEKLVPAYTITSTGYGGLDASEIPPGILEEIIESAQEEDSAMHSVLEDANIEDFSKISLSDFEDFEIDQIHETSYIIDHEGEIEEYSFEHSYSIEDSKVYTMDWSSGDADFFWTPVMLADGTARERRPIAPGLLNDASLEGDVSKVDSSIEEFFKEHDLSQLDKLISLSKEEHISRSLAILGMVSSGFIDLRRR